MKRTRTHRTTTGAVAVTAAVVLSSCASSSGGTAAEETASGSSSEAGTIAFLMPDLASTRYEEQDYPLFEAAVQEQCGFEVLYNNADADAADQQQQVDSAISQGVDAIVLDAVDTAAAASLVNNAQSQDIPIIAYDRPIPDQPADYYVSFDNEAIGASIAQSLEDELAANGITSGGILQVNGSPTDAAAGLIRDGVDSVVDSGPYEVLAEFDTPGWEPPEAQNFVSGQITQFGDQIVGVVAANDGTGGASISAFRSAGVTVPPVTGNDAELAAIQRIVSGDQFNTISKPISTVAEAAAEVACSFAQGETVEPETELFGTPAQLFTPEVVTQENLAEVIVDGGIYTAEEICTAEYAEGCAALGIE